MIFKIALRNLWRNSARTILAVIAMSAATGFLALILSIHDGLLWSIIRSNTEFYHGHLRFVQKDYDLEKDIHHTLSLPATAQIYHQPQIIGVAPRLKGMFLVSGGEAEPAVQQAAEPAVQQAAEPVGQSAVRHEVARSQPVEILGLDLQTEEQVSSFHKAIIAGTHLSNDDENLILVGQELANRLRIGVGSELVVMGQGAYGSLAAGIFYIKGIFNTGDKIRDSRLAILPISAMGELMDFTGCCHEWVAAVHDPLLANTVREELQTKLSDLNIKSWRDLLPQLSQSLDLWVWVQFIVLVIFYFAVVLVSFNIMSMAILERTKEFAVLRAVGFSPARVFIVLCTEGFFLSLTAAVIGSLFAILAGSYLRFYPFDLSFVLPDLTVVGLSFKPQIIALPNVSSIGLPAITMILLGPLVVFLPAIRLLKKPIPQLLGER